MDIELLGIKFKLNRKITAIVIIILIVAVGIAGYIITKGDNGIIIDVSGGNEGVAADQKNSANGGYDDTKQGAGGEQAAQTTASSAQVPGETGEPEETEQADMISIYVVGCVKNPGIVKLKKGNLIDDAIREAGGVTEEADI